MQTLKIPVGSPSNIEIVGLLLWLDINVGGDTFLFAVHKSINDKERGSHSVTEWQTGRSVAYFTPDLSAPLSVQAESAISKTISEHGLAKVQKGLAQAAFIYAVLNPLPTYFSGRGREKKSSFPSSALVEIDYFPLRIGGAWGGN